MSTTEPKIDSFEVFSAWWNGTGEGMSKNSCPRIGHSQAFYLEFRRELANGYTNTLCVNYRPDKMPEEFAAQYYSTDMANEGTYWIAREAWRFATGVYQPIHIAPMLNGHQRPALWYHFAHQSLEDPQMIAYTPSYDYGLRDRQVRVKVGKYLKQFYGDTLNDEQIRHMSNSSKAVEIDWAHGADIPKIYENGPQSCMTGKWRDDSDAHPVNCYGYQYPDGSNEFGLAFTRRGDRIKSRCVVALKEKKFTRTYGDDADVLATLLVNAGYEHISSLAGYGLRLKAMPRDSGGYWMAYLDGNDRGLYGPAADEAGQDYFTWTSDDRGECDYWAENPDGYVEGNGSDGGENDEEYEEYEEVDERPTCGECEYRCDEDDMRYSEHHEIDICHSCVDNHFHTDVITGSCDDDTVRAEETVYCESDDTYYLNRRNVLADHDIVLATDGSYYAQGDCYIGLDNKYIYQNDGVECGGPDSDVYDDRRNITRDWMFSFAEDGLDLYHPEYINTAGEDVVLIPIHECEPARLAAFLNEHPLYAPDWFNRIFVKPPEPAVWNPYTPSLGVFSSDLAALAALATPTPEPTEA